jgi:hypothetical protein
MTFQQVDHIRNNTIASSAIQAAFALYKTGNYVGASIKGVSFAFNFEQQPCHVAHALN